MSNLNFSDQTLTFNSEYDTHHLQARTISKIVDGEQVGSNYIYSQIVTLYTVERKPYVLRDLASDEDNPILYGFAIKSTDNDMDLFFGEVENLESQYYIWLDDFSTGTRIPYQWVLYVKNGEVYFYQPENTKLYPNRFTQCYALVDEDGTYYRIVVIDGDLYLYPESELDLGGE